MSIGLQMQCAISLLNLILVGHFHKKAQMFQLGSSLDFLLRIGTHVLETLENLQVTEKVKVTETVKPQRICLSTFHHKSGLKDISASTLPIT